jgi:dienelactone hydrolase
MFKIQSGFVVLSATLALSAACKSKESPQTPSEPAPPSPAESAPTAEPTPAAAAAKGIKGEEVTYKAGETALKGYIAYDERLPVKRPGVLVVHEWWGHNEYARQRADELAKLGYTAMALDMFGDGKTADHPDDAGKFVAELMNNADVVKNRFEAALAVLKAHPMTNPDSVAAIGYCFGGGVVLNMARAGLDLSAVASFHGMLNPVIPIGANPVKAKVMVFHGADDSFVPKEQVAAFKKEMTKANVDLQFVDYPGVKHAFTNPAATELGKKFNLPLEYNEAADKASWDDMKRGLRAAFVH